MKQCPECNLIYEDNMDVCPNCGSVLQSFEPQRTNNARNITINPYDSVRKGVTSVNDRTYTFESVSGRTYTINGSVAESSTQQYYQSKFTKFFHAIFSGEPYQLSHTTFVTVFRVEEQVRSGFPMNARDIVLYGEMQNLFAVGDDVTVTARRKGSRLVARRVFNHSIDSLIRVQPYIPAGVIRGFSLATLLLLGVLLYMITHIDYAALGSRIVSLIAAFVPALVGIGLIWLMIRSFFKRR